MPELGAGEAAIEPPVLKNVILLIAFVSHNVCNSHWHPSSQPIWAHQMQTRNCLDESLNKKPNLRGTFLMNRIDRTAAQQAGMSLRVYRLQQQLRSLPIHPSTHQLKNERKRVYRRLIQVARQDQCIAKITSWAGCDF